MRYHSLNDRPALVEIGTVRMPRGTRCAYLEHADALEEVVHHVYPRQIISVHRNFRTHRNTLLRLANLIRHLGLIDSPELLSLSRIGPEQLQDYQDALELLYDRVDRERAPSASLIRIVRILRLVRQLNHELSGLHFGLS